MHFNSDRWGYIDPKGKTVIDPQFYGSVGGGQDAGRFVDGLARVSIAGKKGYIDNTGKFVINPQFEYADEFSEGLACVSVDRKKFGFIDKTGALAITPQFDAAGSYSGNGAFSEGLAAVGVGVLSKESGHKYGYIDRTGKWIINPQFAAAAEFINGLAHVCVGTADDYRCGWIDKTGKYVWAPTN